MRIVKLSSICDIIMGQSPKGDSYNNKNEGYPLLNGAADYKGQNFKPKKFTNKPTKLTKKGDVIFGIRATIGNFAFADKQYCIGRGIAALRIYEDRADKYYIIRIVKNELSKIIHRAAGSTIKGVKKEDLTEMLINLPKLETQKKIAAILDEAEKVRQLNKELIAKYDDLTQSLFLEMFGDPVTNPKVWKRYRMDKACLKVTDGTHDTPKRLKKGVKFITGKHIRPFVVDYDNSDYVTKEVHQEIYKRCNPEKGDVLYTNIGVNLGTAALNTVDYEFSMKNVALLKVNNEFLIGRFLEHFLNSPNMKEKILWIASIGGAQKFLSLTQIRRLIVLAPPIQLQNQFAERVQIIENQKQQAQESLQKSEDLFNSLLQKAFKGELVK
ncbi:restriction endonuclease subunit S [uncultured Polaribacter sp.]|uniref:restriction endonuclease subunit S n=1 Tax=uncultured Polaribacter sp. TaxID=174711 RepID=UPI00260E3FD6|nr:restriction endonuclease subunit S [uncultured Polaribacter sp.]